MKGSASRSLRQSLADTAARFRFPVKGQDCEAVRGIRRENHPPGFHTHEFCRLEIRHDDDLFSYQFLRFIRFGNARHDGSLFSDIDQQFQQLV